MQDYNLDYYKQTIKSIYSYGLTEKETELIISKYCNDKLIIRDITKKMIRDIRP